jgi:hypothetical protein
MVVLPLLFWESAMHNQYLPKHTYPLFIKILGIMIFGTFVWVLTCFFRVEFKHIKKLKHKIVQAERCFAHHDYDKAAKKFYKLARQYESFDHAHKRYVQSCFAQSSNEPELFYHAMDYLGDRPEKKYSDAQIKELIAYVPHEYQLDFKLSFTRG